MSDETKKQTANTEMSDEDLANVAGGEGTPDIITGPGHGGGPHVKVFDGRTGREADAELDVKEK